jgi:hypothetical protein
VLALHATSLWQWCCSDDSLSHEELHKPAFCALVPLGQLHIPWKAMWGRHPACCSMISLVVVEAMACQILVNECVSAPAIRVQHHALHIYLPGNICDATFVYLWISAQNSSRVPCLALQLVTYNPESQLNTPILAWSACIGGYWMLHVLEVEYYRNLPNRNCSSCSRTRVLSTLVH